jgi:hypothetical protein
VPLDLAAVVDLLVEGLAAGVVPVLVDPPEDGVVFPHVGERRVVEGRGDVAQGGRGERQERAEPDLAEEPREVGGELLEDAPEEPGVALALVGEEVRGELAELAGGGLSTPAGEHRGTQQPGGLEDAHHHESVEHGGGDALDGLVEHAAARALLVLRGLRAAGAHALVEPRVEPRASHPRRLGKLRLLQRDGESVHPLGLVAEVFAQRLAQRADGGGELLLRLGCQHDSIPFHPRSWRLSMIPSHQPAQRAFPRLPWASARGGAHVLLQTGAHDRPRVLLPVEKRDGGGLPRAEAHGSHGKARVAG